MAILLPAGHGSLILANLILRLPTSSVGKLIPSTTKPATQIKDKGQDQERMND
jgi:hypothetical protein